MSTSTNGERKFDLVGALEISAEHKKTPLDWFRYLSSICSAPLSESATIRESFLYFGYKNADGWDKDELDEPLTYDEFENRLCHCTSIGENRTHDQTSSLKKDGSYIVHITESAF